MSEQPVTTPSDDPSTTRPAPAPPAKKRLRRGAVGTSFSDVPGRKCEVCGFEGFLWQKECPKGHPLG